MPAMIRRAVLVALAGGGLGLMLLTAATLRDPAVVLEMDRNLPRSASGFHGLERDGDTTFVWTAERAVLRFSGLDRSTPWRCVVRFRGARPPELPQPVLEVAVDGVLVASSVATNDFQPIEVSLARRPRAGLSLALTSTPVFVPGGADARHLGVQVDRVACDPRRAWIRPPAAAALAATGGTAAFGAAIVLSGGSITLALILAGVLALGQAATLTAGNAQFSPYAELASVVVLSLAGLVLVFARGLARLAGGRLDTAALGAIGISGLAVALKLLGLLHPTKSLVDALFQAHRLQAVLAGQFFFTQPMPDGVSFPYAIALYVFAAPWTWLASDYVTLLRVVVVAAEGVAGGLLYLLIVRVWQSRPAGLWAVVLFHLIPLPLVVVGNGNLTNAFGQSVALVAMTAAMLWRPSLNQTGRLAGLTLIATMAFCSHVSTLALLGAGLVALAVWLPVTVGRSRVPAALGILASAALGLAISIALYYGHFSDVFLEAATRVTEVAPSPADVPAAPGLPLRLWVGIRETFDKLGWPLLALSAAGVWGLAHTRSRDDLTAGLLAWAAVWIGFVLVTVGTRVDSEFERYAVEFIGRVNLFTYPAFVVLAARAATVLGGEVPPGRAARLHQAVVLVLVLAVGWLGLSGWLTWFR